MPSTFTSLRVKLTTYIGGALTVIGTAALAAVTATSITNSGYSNFTGTAGSYTGAIIQVNGQTRWQTFSSACSGTGGSTGIYSTCVARSPLTTTGTLLGFGIECGNWVVAQNVDVSFKKALISATGTVLTNGNNLAVGTGANLQSMLAVPVSWNPADILTASTITAPSGTSNTTRYNCTFWPILSDKSST